MILKPMHISEYDSDELDHLKNVELMILKDFIKICEDNNIEYISYGGTTLGAVRHEGFIPWADDIDVIMFREEYEKFVKVMESNPTEKYTLITLDNTEDYFYYLSKFSLNGTEFKSSWTRNTKFKLGIKKEPLLI